MGRVMKHSQLTNFVIIYTLALGSFVGFIGGNLASQSDIDWQGWIGSLSGWAAAVAAGATVLTLLHQIRASEKIAFKRANDAKKLFGDKVKTLLHEFNKQWIFIEELDGLNVFDEGLLDGVRHYLDWAKRIKNEYVGTIERYLEDMHPEDRDACEKLLLYINRALDDLPETYPEADQHGNVEEEPISGFRSIQILRLNFQQLDKYAVEFEQSYGEIFLGRPVSRGEFYADMTEFMNSMRLGWIKKNYSQNQK